MLIQVQKYNLSKLLEKYSFQHLRPPPQVMQISIPEDQIFRDMGNGQKKRHIFWRVKYDDHQIQAIQHIKNNLYDQGIIEKFSDQVILKHLYAAKFDYKNTFQRLNKLQQFHTNSIITRLTRQTIFRLQSGCIYSYGYDKQMRPLLIVRADLLSQNFLSIKGNQQKTQTQILKNFNAVYFLLLIVTNYKMLPYHSEKYVTIMDFNDMDFSDIPFLLLYDIFKRMHIYYCSNTQRTFLYNSKGIQKLWNIGKKFIPVNNLKYLIFIEKGKQKDILEYVSQMQLEQKYGGALENLTKYWPPQSTNASFDEVNLSGLSQQTAFYSVQNNMSYFVQNSEVKQNFCGRECGCNIY